MLGRIKHFFPNLKVQNESLTLQNILKPLSILMSLLGLFPYSIQYRKGKQGFAIVRKSIYVNSVSTVSINLLILAFLALHIQEVMYGTESIIMVQAFITQVNYVLEQASLIVYCIVAYTWAYLNRLKYVNILNMIKSTWDDFPPNSHSIKILADLKFQVNVVCMGSLLFVLVLQLCVNYTRANSVWKMILVSFTFQLPQMIQFVTLAFYYILVMMDVALLSNINWHCHRLVKNQQNVWNIQAETKRILSLKKMKLIYIKAFEIKMNINEAFQGPILVTALQSFHSIVSETHIVYHGLAIATTITTHEVIHCSVWIMFQILKIFSLAYSGNTLKVEALKIIQLLHNVPTEKRDDRWMMEIQHFSTLILCQGIELTVYDYFPLDATFMYNMLSSATMYLIILVQFDK